jgi:hypothetical protein
MPPEVTISQEHIDDHRRVILPLQLDQGIGQISDGGHQCHPELTVGEDLICRICSCGSLGLVTSLVDFGRVLRRLQPWYRCCRVHHRIKKHVDSTHSKTNLNVNDDPSNPEESRAPALLLSTLDSPICPGLLGSAGRLASRPKYLDHISSSISSLTTTPLLEPLILRSATRIHFNAFSPHLPPRRSNVPIDRWQELGMQPPETHTAIKIIDHGASGFLDQQWLQHNETEAFG